MDGPITWGTVDTEVVDQSDRVGDVQLG